MARTKKVPATDFNPTEFDPALQQQADVATVPPESTPEDAKRAAAFNATPTSTPRNGHAETVTKRRDNLPDKLTVPAGDTKVQLIDKGDNEAGIGIRVVFPEGAKNRPTEEEKEIIRRHVKGEPGQESGFGWRGDFGLWHKHIARQGEDPRNVPPTRAVAIRLDAETRVQKLADALKQHQVDPAGYAEMIKQERANAPEARVPD